MLCNALSQGPRGVVQRSNKSLVYGALSCLIMYYPVQIMGDLVKPASKDAGGLVQGTVTDLKDKVSTEYTKCLCRVVSHGTELVI